MTLRLAELSVRVDVCLLSVAIQYGMGNRIRYEIRTPLRMRAERFTRSVFYVQVVIRDNLQQQCT